MSDVTRVLDKIQRGDPHAAEQLMPLVYEELRKLAAQKLAQERPGQTLGATAPVHEAYLRRCDFLSMLLCARCDKPTRVSLQHATESMAPKTVCFRDSLLRQVLW